MLRLNLPAHSQLNLVSHLSLNCRSIPGWVVFTEKFKALKSVNIHNIIQTVISQIILEINNQNNYILIVQ